MKVKKAYLLLIIILLPLAIDLSNNVAFAINYSNAEFGVSYIVPDGYIDAYLMKERQVVKEKYTNDTNNSTLIFGYIDMYANLSDEDKEGYIRADINNSAFSTNDVADMFKDTSTVNVDGVDSVVVDNTYSTYETINGKRFFKITLEITMSVYSQSVKTIMISDVIFDNGIMYFFQCGGNADNFDYTGRTQWLNSINLDKVASVPTGNSQTTQTNSTNLDNLWDEFSLGNILLSLFLTVLIYSVPIMIYRYGIKKVPILKREAKKITIVYGICAFFVMTLILGILSEGEGTTSRGGAIILWSCINYAILTGGRGQNHKNDFNNPNTSDIDNDIENLVIANELHQQSTSESIESQQVSFCRKCGAKIAENSNKCQICGTAIN